MQRRQALLFRVSGHRSGFTLLELLVALGITFLLAGLIYLNAGSLVASAQQVICASRMRSLHSGLSLYMQDHKMIWPQGPEPRQAGWANFWITALAPYGIQEKTWTCPVIGKWTQGSNDPELSLHYVPTMFDATPNVANQWTRMPWLIEIGDAHGKGPLMLFPDRSVKPYAKVLAEQGVR